MLYPRCQVNSAMLYPRCQVNSTMLYPRCQGNSTMLYPRCQVNSTMLYPRCQINSTMLYPRCQVNSTMLYPRCTNIAMTIPVRRHGLLIMFIGSNNTIQILNVPPPVRYIFSYYPLFNTIKQYRRSKMYAQQYNNAGQHSSVCNCNNTRLIFKQNS